MNRKRPNVPVYSARVQKDDESDSEDDDSELSDNVDSWEGMKCASPNPYRNIIKAFHPSLAHVELLRKQSLTGGRTDEDRLFFVDTVRCLKEVCGVLQQQPQIGVVGKTNMKGDGPFSVLALSMTGVIYLIDCVMLKTHLHLLQPLFVSPKVLKVIPDYKVMRVMQTRHKLFFVKAFFMKVAFRRLKWRTNYDSYCCTKHNLPPRFKMDGWLIRPLSEKFKEDAKLSVTYLLDDYQEIIMMMDPTMLKQVVSTSYRKCGLIFKCKAVLEEQVSNIKSLPANEAAIVVALDNWRKSVNPNSARRAQRVLNHNELKQLAAKRPITAKGVMQFAKSKYVQKHADEIVQIIKSLRDAIGPIYGNAKFRSQKMTAMKPKQAHSKEGGDKKNIKNASGSDKNNGKPLPNNTKGPNVVPNPPKKSPDKVSPGLVQTTHVNSTNSPKPQPSEALKKAGEQKKSEDPESRKDDGKSHPNTTKDQDVVVDGPRINSNKIPSGSLQATQIGSTSKDSPKLQAAEPFKKEGGKKKCEDDSGDRKDGGKSLPKTTIDQDVLNPPRNGPDKVSSLQTTRESSRSRDSSKTRPSEAVKRGRDHFDDEPRRKRPRMPHRSEDSFEPRTGDTGRPGSPPSYIIVSNKGGESKSQVSFVKKNRASFSTSRKSNLLPSYLGDQSALKVPTSQYTNPIKYALQLRSTLLNVDNKHSFSNMDVYNDTNMTGYDDDNFVSYNRIWKKPDKDVGRQGQTKDRSIDQGLSNIRNETDLREMLNDRGSLKDIERSRSHEHVINKDSVDDRDRSIEEGQNRLKNQSQFDGKKKSDDRNRFKRKERFGERDSLNDRDRSIDGGSCKDQDVRNRNQCDTEKDQNVYRRQKEIKRSNDRHRSYDKDNSKNYEHISNRRNLNNKEIFIEKDNLGNQNECGVKDISGDRNKLNDKESFNNIEDIGTRDTHKGGLDEEDSSFEIPSYTSRLKKWANPYEDISCETEESIQNSEALGDTDTKKSRNFSNETPSSTDTKNTGNRNELKNQKCVGSSKCDNVASGSNDKGIISKKGDGNKKKSNKRNRSNMKKQCTRWGGSNRSYNGGNLGTNSFSNANDMYNSGCFNANDTIGNNVVNWSNITDLIADALTAAGWGNFNGNTGNGNLYGPNQSIPNNGQGAFPNVTNDIWNANWNNNNLSQDPASLFYQQYNPSQYRRTRY